MPATPLIFPEALVAAEDADAERLEVERFGNALTGINHGGLQCLPQLKQCE